MSGLLKIIDVKDKVVEPCEYIDKMACCEHPDLEDDMLCQRNGCPWPEKKSDEVYWRQHKGLVPEPTA